MKSYPLLEESLLSAFSFVRHCDRACKRWFWPIHERARQVNPRAEDCTNFNSLAPLQLGLQRAERIAQSRYPVGKIHVHCEEREELPRIQVRVRVHVPQARDEELTRSVNDLSAFRYFDSTCLADRRDAVARNHRRHIRLDGSAGGINHRDVGENERARRRNRPR